MYFRKRSRQTQFSSRSNRRFRCRLRSKVFERLEERSLLAAVAPPSGLVSWWTGDTSSEDITGRNDAVPYYGAGFATGKVAGGFNFDGVDDAVVAPTSGIPVGSADRTIELWARIDQFNQDGRHSLLATYGTPGEYSHVYSIGVQADQRSYVSTWGRAIFGPVLEAGQWYHFAVTNTGRSFKLYLDGGLVASGELDVDTPSGTDFKIGRHVGAPEYNRVDGMVDEVSVYDRALSPSEIQSIYSAGSSGKIKNAYITADFPTVNEGAAEPVAEFTIRRSGSLAGQVEVQWQTVDGSAKAGQDYVSASGTLLFANGESQKTIEVAVLGDTIPEPDETFRLEVSTTDPGYAVLSGYATVLTDDGGTKFYVVDSASSGGETFEYASDGDSGESYGLASTTPRGAASSVAGDKVWVVDANKKVYVYSPSGSLLGSWTAAGLTGSAQVEGIATNGTDMWIVDAKSDKVFKYTAGASFTQGTHSSNGSFSLDRNNKDSKDIVTDGTYLYIVNDSTVDKVFKYTLTGRLIASWTISTSWATSPTGITLDPSNPSHLWIVDSGTDTVYEYADAVNQPDNSSKSANANFLLGFGNTNPQGIADPGFAAYQRLGDFDFDSVVGAADIDLLFEQLRQMDRALRFDLTNDSRVDEADRDRLIREILHTDYGDTNLDGRFDSADLVPVFQAGEYEDAVDDNSTWADGDWDGDGDFTTSDLVLAFQTGRYEAQPQGNASEIAASVDWLFAQDQRVSGLRAYLA